MAKKKAPRKAKARPARRGKAAKPKAKRASKKPVKKAPTKKSAAGKRKLKPAPKKALPPATRIIAPKESKVKKLVLVFLGPPGVGKGTQAAKLAAALKLPHISTGDLFQQEPERGTHAGLGIKCGLRGLREQAVQVRSQIRGGVRVGLEPGDFAPQAPLRAGGVLRLSRTQAVDECRQPAGRRGGRFDRKGKWFLQTRRRDI